MENKLYISKIRFIGLIEDDELILSDNDNDTIVDETMVDKTFEGAE